MGQRFWTRACLACAAVAAWLGCHVAASSQEIALASHGQSAYVIYRENTAPSSVKLAAEELQQFFERATKARLPIVDAPTERMICLGSNEASRRAGLGDEDLPDEGFRIVTRNANLYIVGKDWPDQAKKWDQCDSTGTLYGVYEFLERQVGVRWLMPGPEGDSITDHADGLTIPSLDISGSPAIPARIFRILDISRFPQVRQWALRNRIGQSINPVCGHNWSSFPSTSVLEAHPQYMPLQADGTRQKPVGNRGWGSYEHKFCLSNPGLVEAYAQCLIASLDAHPRQFGQSMAPADGGLWCMCPSCRGRMLTEAAGSVERFAPYEHSVTPLVLDFYNAVARIVGQKHPHRLIGGLAYQDYLYPPTDAVKVEPNVYICIAVNTGYGFKFYKPQTASRLRGIISGWSRIAPNLGWMDYSTWMRNCAGAPLPPGLDILQDTFAAFGKSLKLLDVWGQDAFGYGGAHNYVVVKMMWNPEADPQALYKEFIDLAYGPAAPSLDAIYQLVEERLRPYIISKPYPDHEVWYDTAQQVYAPIHAKIEELYFQARSQARTDAQRRRVDMFGDNLVMLNWNLRQAGLIPANPASPLHRTDPDYARFLAEKADSPGIVSLRVFDEYRWQTAIWSPQRRTLDIQPVATPPVIDGQLGDPTWSHAALADDFQTNERRRDAAHWQSSVRVGYDRDNLYLSVDCREDDPKAIRSECRVHGSRSIYQDDSIEIHVLTPQMKEPVSIAVNAANTLYAYGRISAVTGAAITATGWSAELAIPFRSLGLEGPAVGEAWRVNFARRRVGPPIEQSSWCRVEEALGDPRAFGEIHFMP
ncbi:MAG: DUF4838 domain-containing protein [Phycisphaeraceae bacterium]|nr:DUF4838 domain-containing protein [Phycisphaeraceae bacterium]